MIDFKGHPVYDSEKMGPKFYSEGKRRADMIFLVPTFCLVPKVVILELRLYRLVNSFIWLCAQRFWEFWGFWEFWEYGTKKVAFRLLATD